METDLENLIIGVASFAALGSMAYSVYLYFPGRKNKQSEQYNGLPLITNKNFMKAGGFLDPNGKLGREQPTFDFKGYVRCDDDVIFYQDLVATAGLRGGIHVLVRGNNSHIFRPESIRSPADMTEYEVLIYVSADVQQREGIVCIDDSIYSEQEFKQKERVYGTDDEISERMDEIRKGFFPAIVGLQINPALPDSRAKVIALHTTIVNYIRTNRPLAELDEVISLEHAFLVPYLGVLRLEPDDF